MFSCNRKFLVNTMPNGDLPQGMYTPIPQNMTDSDSEEEFNLHTTNYPIKLSTGRIHNTSNVHAVARFNAHHHDNLNESVPDVRYDIDKSYNMTNHCNVTSDADNVAILNTTLTKSQPMSALRKFCFIVSIFVCILTIILFVWVLPCSDSETCPAPSERIHTHNWLRNYERVELKGAINVVHGIRGRSMNLVFMYRGNKISTDKIDDGGLLRKRNGIISLIGSTGQVGWYDEMISEPSIIDCTLIDADLNNEPDCLVIEEFGEIGCINPMSGQWLWHIADKTTNNPAKLSFPLIIPDVNEDGVKDLLIACTVTNGTYNSLKLISGASGRTIGQSYTIEKCSYIHKFQLDENLKISFNCIIINNDTEVRVTKQLSELYTSVTNRTIQLPNGIDKMEINQHKFYGQRKDTLSQRNIYAVSGKQLIVENYGICPDSCNVTVTLQEERNGKPNIIRNFNGTRMYGMVPALLSFNNSGAGDNIKSSVHGFVIKFWEWTDNSNTTPNKRVNTTEFNKFENILRKKRAWNSQQSQLISNGNKNDVSSGNSKVNSVIISSRMRLIKETVVLIVFNSTDIRIENTSQSNIVQFCQGDGNNEMCQPDLNYQENSVLIADLDQDGSQELVSYYSTFVENEHVRNKWKLMTYVQLLRLESELPKLYAIDGKH